MRWFCVWCKTRVEFYFFECRYPVVPTLRWREYLVSIVHCLHPCWRSFDCGFISGFYPLFHWFLCVFLCQYYINLITKNRENQEMWCLQLCLSSWRLLWKFGIFSHSTQILGLFFYFYKTYHWILIDCIKSVGHLGYYGCFNNNESSNPWAWDTFPFLCVFNLFHQCFLVQCTSLKEIFFTLMFITALFAIARTWKQFKYSLTENG